MKIIFFTVYIFISLCASAQTGIITGRVYDQLNNEPLIGVVVKIDSTGIGTVSDVEGHYTISEVNPGTYNLVVSYMGYETKKITGVTIINEKIKNIDITLSSGVSELKEVSIVAKQDKQSTGLLLSFQQNSLSMVDGKSAEDIKKSPDKNTSEVLRRISGASIQDNKFVIIRGLSDRYNTALINGMPLPTSEPDRKAFSFDIFPSSMLDNLVIYKTATPDLPGDFAGGVIQVNTRDIPDERFVNLSAGTSFNSISTFREFITYNGGKKDWIGIDDGTRNLSDEIPDTKIMKGFLKTPFVRDSVSTILKNNWSIQSIPSSPLSQNYQLALGGHTKILKNDFGMILSMTYNNARKKTLVERSDYNNDTSTIFRYMDTQYKENILWGTMLNFAYKLGENNKFSLKNMLTVNSEDMVTARYGTNFENDRYEKGTTMQFISNEILTSQLSGEHFIPTPKIKIKWGGSYTKTHRDVPDLRRMLYIKNFEDTVYSAVVQAGSASPNYAGMFYSDLFDDTYTANTDVSIPFNLFEKKQIFRFGGSTQHKVRSFDARVFGYVIASPAKFDWSLLNYGSDSIFNPDNIGVNNGFRLQETTNPSDSYDAQSTLNAGFLMFNNSLLQKIRLVWGARVESYNLKVDTYKYGGDTINIDTTYIDILPSANLIYAVTDNSNIRLSVSKTVSRPEFREIAPFSFFDFNTFSAIIGNDTLVPASITNFDLRYEIYPHHNQVFSITGFYKDFKNPIENIAYYGGAGSRTVSFQNVKKAINYGFETEYRLKLSLLDSLFKTSFFGDITFSSNLAYIISSVDLRGTKGIDSTQTERPLQGQSPYVINSGLQYVNHKYGTGISVLFNKFGRRITEVGSNGYKDIYEAPRSLFDMQISQKFWKRRAEARFTVSDVFNQKSVFYQDENNSKKYEQSIDKKISEIESGTNYSFSLSFRF